MGSLDSDMTLKFTELIEFFERNIEHMETKVQELENDLTEGVLLAFNSKYKYLIIL